MNTRTWLTILLCGAAVILAQRTAFAAEHEFKYKAQDASSVELMCEFNGWKAVAMTKGDDGVWKVKIALPTGTHAYKFLVDGKDWVMDPENSAKKSVDGAENSAVEIK